MARPVSAASACLQFSVLPASIIPQQRWTPASGPSGVNEIVMRPPTCQQSRPFPSSISGFNAAYYVEPRSTLVQVGEETKAGIRGHRRHRASPSNKPLVRCVQDLLRRSCRSSTGITSSPPRLTPPLEVKSSRL